MAGRKNNGGLTDKQQIFVAEYLKDRNGPAAAVRAGYSKTSASVQASTMLALPEVRELVNKHTENIRRRSEVTAEFVIEELAKVASQEDVAQSTKVRALELLAKHLGMLEDRIAIKTDGLSSEQRAERVAILLERVRSRE